MHGDTAPWFLRWIKEYVCGELVVGIGGYPFITRKERRELDKLIAPVDPRALGVIADRWVL